jgi:hypothetical protein
LNEKQYKELCGVCDQLLLAGDSKIERVAIPWLHIIREHPVFLSKYAALFDGKDIGFSTRAYARIHGLLYFLRSIAGIAAPWVASDELPDQIDFLFLSHLLSPGQAGDSEDFYFGDLPGKLVAQKKKVVIALMNHTKAPAGQLIAKWRNAAVPRVLLTDNIGIAAGTSFYRSMLHESKVLRQKALKSGELFQQRILSRASAEALSGSTFANLRLNHQIEILCRQLSPRNILVTHEGHAFERMAFSAAHRAVPGINCIGYQHSGLFRLQHAIRRKLAPPYNPGQIMTSGPIAKLQLEHEPGLAGTRMAVLGSNRYFDSGQSGKNLSAENNCLVLPEGIIGECELLFRFSLECAQQMPNTQFTWRLHPSITFKDLQENTPGFRHLPANIILSAGSLDDDIAKSQWVLYRGSTAVVKAVGGGTRPVYFSVPGEMTIDPLYGISTGKAIVTNSDDLSRLLKHTTEDNGKAEAEMETLQAYCRQYFVPFDPAVLTAPDLLSN